MSKKLTLEYFLSKSKELHGEKYDYSLVKINKAKDKITIICPIHGEFKQTTYLHYKKAGCIKCSYIKVGDALRLSNNTFIEKAKIIHKNYYDYSLINYINTYKNINIICPKGHIFKQSPSNHLRGDGCSICAIKNRKYKKMTSDDFIKKAEKVHNYRYCYIHTQYKTSHEKVLINCKNHGEFEQSPSNHLSGKGCPICSRIVSTAGYKKIKDKDAFKITCYLYLIKIKENEDYFYKIGVSTQPKIRHTQEYYKNNYTEIFNINTNLDNAIYLENKILKLMKNYKYKPLIKFGGHTECFKEVNDGECIDMIVEYLKSKGLYVKRES